MAHPSFHSDGSSPSVAAVRPPLLAVRGWRALLAGVALVVVPTACTYLKYSAIQREYARLQDAEPSQRNLKHMIDRPNFAVIGHTHDGEGLHAGAPMAIAVLAFSSRFRPHELVDAMHDIRVGTHFGLDLPEGDYDLLVVADLDASGFYERDEVIGCSALTLAAQDLPSMVVPKHRIELAAPSDAGWPLAIEVQRRAVAGESLFYPAGSIRSLDDPIFADEMVTLGLYDPASFFDQAPTLFYALEEDLGFKVPVVFVHGAGGSARDFEVLVQQLDRSRFKPWFFYYPSGGDLDQLGKLFHDIFLSGQTVVPSEFVPMVIVAHSMGGLVVRRALREVTPDGEGPSPIVFVSLASPFGGHPSARGVQDSSMLILPSWRDLDPDSGFIAELFDRPLPAGVTHHLFHAFSNDSMLKLGENSDGVVPLSSQLHPPAQRQSSVQLGLDTTHVGILRDPDAVAAVVGVLDSVETRIPPEHMACFQRGGFAVDGAGYTDMERFLLRHYGCFLEALAAGELEPMDPSQEQLVPMLRGEVEPSLPGATAWQKFVANGRR